MDKENVDEIEYPIDEKFFSKLKSKMKEKKENPNKKAFVPFDKRTDYDWSDVKPVPQFSPEVEIMKIDFNDQFLEVSNYFRAILIKNEISHRAFDLTTEMILLNATNYMAWFHRRNCIDQLNIDLKKELNWLDEIGVENQKNYQIWHHRKVVIEKLNYPLREKLFLDEVFSEENKNFHAWCHRIWVVRRFNLFEGEYDFIDKLLDLDIRNNSVWNYRFFVVSYTKKIDAETLNQEIEYTFDKIDIVNNNESPYNYIRGFFDNSNLPIKFEIKDFPKIKERLDKIIQKDPKCVFAHSLLLEWHLAFNEIEKSKEICDLLGGELDLIRKKYWAWRKLNFTKNIEITQQN